MNDSHGLIRLHLPSNRSKSLAIPVSPKSTVGELREKLHIPALFLQLGFQQIRQLSDECRPLSIQLDILAALGYEQLEERLRVGHSTKMRHIFCFLIASAEPSSALSLCPSSFASECSINNNIIRSSSSSSFTECSCLVRPGGDGLLLGRRRWQRRKCALKSGGQTIRIGPSVLGGKQEVLLHVALYRVQKGGPKTLRLVPNSVAAAAASGEWHLRFEDPAQLEEWERRLAQASLVPSADLSNRQLLFLPADLLLLGQHRLLSSLNLRRNSLQCRLHPSPILWDGIGTKPIGGGCTEQPGRWVDDIGLAFPSLRQLSLADNRLQRFPISLLQLSALTELDLSGNRLLALPPKIHLLTNLTHLNLANNWLAQLPSTLAKCAALKSLDLSFNRLPEIPAVLLRLPNLSSWSLAGNAIASPALPMGGGIVAKPAKITLRLNPLRLAKYRPTHSPLCAALTSLDFRDCGHRLAELELSSLSRLESLHCERNGIHKLTLNGSALRELFASENELESLVAMPLPSCLSLLQLGHNRLLTLPDWSTDLPKLVSFEVQNNRLRRLPARIFMSVPSLRRLNAANNRLEQLPEVLQHCQLESLILNGNRLETLPQELFRFASKLRFLNCSQNRLGSLPSRLSGQSQSGIRLKELRLSFNRLPARAIQPLLGQLRHLRLLDLSHNQLRLLPASVASLRALEELNVSANRLQMLPGQLFRLPKLHSLWAHSNQISRFPALLSAAKSLKVLDLSANKLDQWPTKTELPPMLEQLDLTCNPPLAGQKQGKIGALPLPASQLVDLDQLKADNNNGINNAASHLHVNNFCFGLSQCRGQRQKLCLRQLFLHCRSATFFVLIDGGNNAAIAESVRAQLEHVLLAEQPDIVSASAAKLALLRVLERLGHQALELGAAVLLVGIPRQQRNATASGALFCVNCGHCSALLIRHGPLEPIWLAREPAPSTPLELERIRAAGAILTEEGLVNGLCPSGHALGFTGQFPAILPDPSKYLVKKTAQCHSVVIANRHVWASLEIKCVEALVKQSKSAQQAAKNIQDAVQANNCEENIGVIVVGLGKEWTSDSHFPV